MSSLRSAPSVRGAEYSADIAHKHMKDDLIKAQEQIKELKDRIQRLEMYTLKGNLDDVQTERVLNTNTSGTPSTNTLLRNITLSVTVPYSLSVTGDPETLIGSLIGSGIITVLDYPERIKIDTWKGQRLAIPVYDADKIIYPQ